MKKLAAILLIFLFVFNLCGYRLVLYYAQQRADSRLEHHIDNNEYSDNELISITIPISMPYQQGSHGFERFDGEITWNGKLYKFVKRQYGEDKITYLCLPDSRKMHLEKVKGTLATTDVQGADTKKPGNSKSSSGKMLLTEYNQHIFHYSFLSSNALHVFSMPDHSGMMSPGSHSSPEQPPEAA